VELRRTQLIGNHALPPGGAFAIAALLFVLGLHGGSVQLRADGRSWYVAGLGSPRAAGTVSDPLDLRTALSKQSPAKPGDTIWVRGGVYRGRFDSFLVGTPNAPIVVRQAPGERATIDSNDGTINPPDGGLNLRAGGAYAWYMDLEVMNSDTKRTSVDLDAFPTDLYRANGVNVYTSNVKLINLVIHDVDNGIFVGDTNQNVDIYGVLSYYNGHEGPTQAWGHGIYVQNASISQPRNVRDNITAANFSHGLHAYGSADRGLNSIRLEGNISYQNGVISKFHLVRNLLLGGLSVAGNAAVVKNYTYYSRPDGENNIGWTAGAPGAVVMDNYFMGGRTSLVWGPGQPSRLSGNVFYAPTSPATIPNSYPANIYYGNQRPTRLEYFVRANEYEQGRANIAVYNWPLQSSVAVDIGSAGLRNGALFEVRDAQNYFGEPVVTGIYDGTPITLPLSPRPVAQPIGNIQAAQPISTLPEFAAFVLRPILARRR
jgi:hypothetical protein